MIDDCTNLTVVSASNYVCGQYEVDCDESFYVAHWILSNKDCKTIKKNVWFGKREQPNQPIIIAMGCLRGLERIKILNHFNLIGGDSFQNIW